LLFLLINCIFGRLGLFPLYKTVQHMLIAHVARNLLLGFWHWLELLLNIFLVSKLLVHLLKHPQVAINLINRDLARILRIDHAENRLILSFINRELLLHFPGLRVGEKSRLLTELFLLL